MNGSQRDVWGPSFGPWAGMFQSVVGNLDSAALGSEPMVKGLARVNLEAFALANRRAQAYLEIPSRLARCRTPQDLAGEQMRFWQTAYTQYGESSRKLISIWSSMMPGMSAFAATYKNGVAKERDFITFPEPKDETPAKRGTGARRAA